MRREDGSLTVEAAISLPIFLMVILSIIFLIKLVYVHEVIQHAIHETANEIATYSYLLNVSGIKDLDDIISDGTKDRGQLFNEHLDEVVEAYESLSDLSDVPDFTEKIEDIGQEVLENPLGEIFSFVYSLGGLAYEDFKTTILENSVKVLMKKYISPNNASMANERLKALNIEGGISDLDFSQSNFFKDNDDIDIIVRYKVNLALPINILPDLYIIQRATVKGWLNGY